MFHTDRTVRGGKKHGGLGQQQVDMMTLHKCRGNVNERKHILEHI